MIEIWSEICRDDTLSKITSIVTIISLVVAPLFFFVKRWYDKRSERKMVSKNLHGELQDALDALDDKLHPKDFFTLKFSRDREIQYMNRSLNHDVYDSLIFSGKINFLRHDLQQQIQDIFKRIKAHNKYIIKTGEMLVKDKGNAQVYVYYERLEYIEKILLESIPATMKKLAKDTKIT